MFRGMNTVWFKTDRIFIIALLIALTHFILTSLAAHYIAIQVGTQTGLVVAEGIIKASEKGAQNSQKSEEKAKRIYQ